MDSKESPFARQTAGYRAVFAVPTCTIYEDNDRYSSQSEAQEAALANMRERGFDPELQVLKCAEWNKIINAKDGSVTWC